MSDSAFHIETSILLPQVKLQTRRKILDRLAELAAPLSSTESSAISARLIQRERMATSGIGGGIAIPHLRLRQAEKPVFILMTLASPVDFDSVDRHPVDIVAMQLSPESDGPLHLRRLARLSRMLRDEGLCEQLRNARSENELSAILGTTPQRAAA